MYSIELDRSLDWKAKNRLATTWNAVLRNGNSADMIRKITGELRDAPALFFLDGHWSDGITALGRGCQGGR
eukprot:COSAG05_NODE_3726_length_1879_cov_1.489326_2_plen_71_part_00